MAKKFKETALLSNCMILQISQCPACFMLLCIGFDKMFFVCLPQVTTAGESTGFLKSTPKPIDISAIPQEFQKLIEDEMEAYNKIYSMRLKPE